MQVLHYTIPVRGGATQQLTVDQTVHGPILTQAGQTVAVDWMGAAGSPDLADMLARPVIDQTNFTGPFDVHMRWTPDESTPGRRSGETLPETSESAPSFITALEEQLGVKLETGKGPVETINIEHAEKPVGN